MTREPSTDCNSPFRCHSKTRPERSVSGQLLPVKASTAPQQSGMLFGVKSLRHIVLTILFVLLIALEITHGAYRIRVIQDGERAALIETVARGVREVAGELRRLLAGAREHATYLSRLLTVQEVLESSLGVEGPRRALEASLLPYVVSFRGIDHVRLLDPGGKERFRCEKTGNGVGSIPEPRLERDPDFGVLALLRNLLPGVVLASGFIHDSDRVEVPESDRKVLYIGAPIDRGTTRLGYLLLTIYASPILNRVRSFRPFPQVDTGLVDAEGAYLAQTDPSRERGQPTAGNLQWDIPGALERIRSGESSMSTASGIVLSENIGDVDLGWTLVSLVPTEAIRSNSQASSEEYAWVVGTMVTATATLAIAGFFLVRMSLREVALREAARYRQQELELTRRKQLSERLESLGLLTAGVAHEINNPLEGIENYLALLERESGSKEKQKRYVELLRYGFHRIRDIVRDLSSFARPGVETGTADVAAAVTHALKMVAYTKEFKQVKVELQGLESTIHVNGEGRRLEQVFLNLFLNAGRAMGGEGTISITAKPVPGTDGADEVEIAIEDTGPGIPPEVLPRIFDPFFTTANSTGLGLSISYGIVEAHGGSLRAENSPGGGARFLLRLPTARPVTTLARQERGEK